MSGAQRWAREVEAWCFDGDDDGVARWIAGLSGGNWWLGTGGLVWRAGDPAPMVLLPGCWLVWDGGDFAVWQDEDFRAAFCRTGGDGSGYTVEQTADYYRGRVLRLTDRVTDPGYRRSVRDVVLLESLAEFLRRVRDRDLDVFAPGGGGEGGAR